MRNTLFNGQFARLLQDKTLTPFYICIPQIFFGNLIQKGEWYGEWRLSKTENETAFRSTAIHCSNCVPNWLFCSICRPPGVRGDIR